MKVTNWLFWIFFLLFFGSALLMTSDLQKREKVNFVRFDSTDIIGVISGEIYQGGSGVHIVIEGYGEEFVFEYHSKGLDEIFSYVAKDGDSIIKPAYFDTLTLITNDRSYKYTIKKY